jgi:hypothetical protein
MMIHDMIVRIFDLTYEASHVATCEYMVPGLFHLHFSVCTIKWQFFV